MRTKEEIKELISKKEDIKQLAEDRFNFEWKNDNLEEANRCAIKMNNVRDEIHVLNWVLKENEYE